MSITRELIHAAVYTPGPGGAWGLPLLFEGEPGGGKTSYLDQFARSWGLHFEGLSPSLRGEGAFGVVPVPVDGVLRYPPPDYAKACDEQGAILLCDEINTVGGQLQAAMLGMVAFPHTVGSHRFGPRVRVLGAMNPVAMAANGYDLSPPLANRFGHVRWEPASVDEHAAYMLGGGVGITDKRDARQEEARVTAAWGEAWAQAVGVEIGFLQAQPHWKNKCPKEGEPAASRAWPSDRTWDYATRALAAAEVHRMSAGARDEFVRAFIGSAAAEQFAAFIEGADLPRAADVLDGRVKFAWEAKRMDRCAAIVASCAALVVPAGSEKRVDRAEKLWEILGGTNSYDVTVPAAQALVCAGLHVSKPGRAVLNKMLPVLQPVLLSCGLELGASLS